MSDADIPVLQDPQIDQAMLYEEMKEELERKYLGKWVVIGNYELLGSYESFNEAKEAAKAAGIGFSECCIAQVGVPAPIILV